MNEMLPYPKFDDIEDDVILLESGNPSTGSEYMRVALVKSESGRSLVEFLFFRKERKGEGKMAYVYIDLYEFQKRLDLGKLLLAEH